MRKPKDHEILRRLTTGDRFFGRFCYRCTSRRAAFVVRDRFVGVCPLCVLDRIAELERKLKKLPPDIEVFRGEALREVLAQKRREKLALSVDWNYLWKCRRCGHPVRKEEVRIVPAEKGDEFTHCRVCYACYLVRLEEERIRQGAAFDEKDPFREGKSYGGLRPCNLPLD